MIPISLEFLNFSRVGLISYIFHGDLNNTLGIRHSSRETSLESISEGRPEGDPSMPTPPPESKRHFKVQEFRSGHLYILFNTFVKCKLRNCKNFLNIKKILTVLPLDNTLHRNQALL